MITRLILGAAALGAIALFRKPRTPEPELPVRDAGPSQMRNPPPTWDRTDEAIDESFPASDPPGTY
ncbi:MULTISPECIES: hypothetical protein [Actibacterium]|jgi:hypothetical protein|uniref:Uncharacterized protein n=1 Tax=Actibacterium naphthalenivorans TaxID=1614693 RepID=A0A840CIN6_9RHOB|nr:MULTISPECIES: hypothetical protein [Actibacterium]ALG92355.1 hypothetical protein TQ29_19315 [Actibacterium sp. EMB200-NS6]MBB4024002.1 hypothetical protein [Actibacterium naphthalenivorans]